MTLLVIISSLMTNMLTSMHACGGPGSLGGVPMLWEVPPMEFHHPQRSKGIFQQLSWLRELLRGLFQRRRGVLVLVINN